MVFMNRYDGQAKLQLLLDALAGCDGRRSYYLSIATCYCTPKVVREFIDPIRAILRIEKIYLYIDRRTAISIGRAALSAIEEDYSELLSIYAVRAGRLFHTKGYCLAAYSGEDLVHGRVAIGSPNLTGSGLTREHGNIESLSIHSDIPTIGEFLEFFNDEDNLIALEDLADFSPRDAADFQYALLTSGWFSHKWSATLATCFSVRYHLNEYGRRRAKEGTGIRTPGFQMAAASIGKRYVKDKHFKLQDWRQSKSKTLVKNYLITTQAKFNLSSRSGIGGVLRAT